MKTLIWPLLLVLSCSQGKNSIFTTGGGTASSANGNSTTLLNYRINQAAIDQHSSFLFLGQLETWDEAAIPLAWGHINASTLRELFRYLHKQETSEVTQVRHTYEGTRSRLDFTLIQGKAQLLVDRLVQRVEWPDHAGGPLLMQKLDPHNWMLELEGETLLWHAGEQRLCHNDICVDI